MIYLTPGTFYPPHAHDAIELYHPVIGDALWGPSKKYLKPVDPDNFVLHPSALPHAFEVYNGPMCPIFKTHQHRYAKKNTLDRY